MLCWFEKGYVRTPWKLWFFDPRDCSWELPYRKHKKLDYLHIEVVRVIPNIIYSFVVPTICGISKRNISQFIHQSFGQVSTIILWGMLNKGLIKGIITNLLDLDNPNLSISWINKLKLLEAPKLMSQSLPLGSCFKWIFNFSKLNASLDLLELLWIYIPPLHTPLSLPK